MDPAEILKKFSYFKFSVKAVSPKTVSTLIAICTFDKNQSQKIISILLEADVLNKKYVLKT